MRIPLLFTFLFCLSANVNSQVNLAKNGSFEEVSSPTFKPCEYNKSDKRFNLASSHWNTFSGLTPDLIVWEEGCRYPKPHHGEKMIGIITFHPKLDTGWEHDFHEFVQGELTAPLEKGLTYTVEFWVHQNDSIAEHHLLSVYGRKAEIIPTAAGNLGVYFAPRRFDEREYMQTNVTYQSIFPQVNHSEPIVTEYGEWAKLSFTFEADQRYRFFTIGNFKPDAETENTLPDDPSLYALKANKKGFWGRPKRVAYYCIDDVRIFPSEASHGTRFVENLLEEKTYTFKNVTFESGSAKLLPASFPELDGLVNFLENNPDVRIQINGHTDNVGSEEANLSLSKKRVGAIIDYLVRNHIYKSRIRGAWHGESQPIAPNDTPEGRAKNRRVEVTVL